MFTPVELRSDINICEMWGTCEKVNELPKSGADSWIIAIIGAIIICMLIAEVSKSTSYK